MPKEIPGNEVKIVPDHSNIVLQSEENCGIIIPE